MGRAWRSLAFILLLAPVFGTEWPRAGLRGPALRLKQDGSFKIALFCDMHFGEDMLVKDSKSVTFEETMLHLESPDLVVIDGDASSNYAAPLCDITNGFCKDWFLQNWRRFTAPMESAGVPYAYTLGNHDRIRGPHPGPLPGNESSYVVPDHWIISKDATNPHSVSQDGPQSIHGASNYVVPILGPGGKPVAYIWLLDSSDTDCMGVKGWGCVYPDQVQWYLSLSEQLAKRDGRVLPGVMFHHIPLDEVNAAWNDPTVVTKGTKAEDVCCFSVNTGLFDAIKKAGNIWGVFHGHDHNNDFVALYRGVHIGYGRKSGYGGYGGQVADKPGSRVIELQLQANGTVEFDTWIRLESGEKLVQTAAQRTSVQGQCCGAATPSRQFTSIEEARQLCRVHDDPSACRAAVAGSFTGVI